MPWRGIYSGLPIEFKIDDKDFLEQVYDQEIKFGNGTSITCNLQIETKTTIKDDIEEAKNADRVILLNKGEIVDCDKPQKILTNEKLLKELKGVPKEKRGAQFVCQIVLVNENDKYLSIRGEVRGRILEELSGKEGFGYDPLFFYAPLNKTFGELSSEEKNSVSHRACALKELKNRIKEIIN